MDKGIALTSSRNIVPPEASSNFPICPVLLPPVKAPFA